LSGLYIVLGVLILVGAFHGYKAGFLLELFSLVAVVLGVLAGFKFMGWAMVTLAGKFDINEKVLPYVAFAAVFVVIVIIVNLLGRLVKASVDKTFLGPADQTAGALLGLLRTVFAFSVVLWIVDSLKLSLMTKWTEDSWLYPMVAAFAPKLTHWISGIFPFFNDVF
jgi:membrane protein required for colicin V production